MNRGFTDANRKLVDFEKQGKQRGIVKLDADKESLDDKLDESEKRLDRYKRESDKKSKITLAADTRAFTQSITGAGRRLQSFYREAENRRPVVLRADTRQYSAALVGAERRARNFAENASEAARISLRADNAPLRVALTAAMAEVRDYRERAENAARFRATSQLQLDAAPLYFGLTSARQRIDTYQREATRAARFDLTASTDNLARSLAQARARLAQYAGARPVPLPLTLDTLQAESDTQRFIDWVKQSQAVIEIAASLGGATVSVETWLATTAARSPSISIDAHTANAYRKAHALATGISRLPATITIDANTDPADRAVAGLRTSIATIRGANVDIGANAGEAKREIVTVRSMSEALDKADPNVDVTTSGFAAANSQLGLLGMNIRRINNTPVRVGFDAKLARKIPTLMGDALNKLLQFQTTAAILQSLHLPMLLTGMAGLAGAAGVAGGAVGGLALELGAGLAGAAGTAGTAMVLGGAAVMTYRGVVMGAIESSQTLTQELASQRAATQGANAAVTAAQQAVNQAKPGTVEYRQAVANLSAAQARAGEEQRKLALLQTKATPAMLRLGRTVETAKLEFASFAGTLQSTAAPAIEQFIMAGVRALPAMRGPAQGMIRDMNGVALSFLKTAQSGQQLFSIRTILMGIRNAGAPAMKVLTNAALVFINTFSVMVPTGLELLGVMARLSHSAAVWTGTAEGQTRIASVWTSLVAAGQRLWGVVSNLGVGLWGIARAIQASGTAALMARGLTVMSERFRAMTEAGSQGQARLTAFFRTTRPVLFAVGRLLTAVVQEFLHTANMVGTLKNEATGSLVLVDIFDAITFAVRTFGSMLRHEFATVGPKIAPLIVEMAKVAEVFFVAQPPLLAFLDVLISALTWFNELPKPIRRAAATAVSFGLAFNALTGALAGGGSLLGSLTGFVQMRQQLALMNVMTGTSATRWERLKFSILGTTPATQQAAASQRSAAGAANMAATAQTRAGTAARTSTGGFTASAGAAQRMAASERTATVAGNQLATAQTRAGAAGRTAAVGMGAGAAAATRTTGAQRALTGATNANAAAATRGAGAQRALASGTVVAGTATGRQTVTAQRAAAANAGLATSTGRAATSGRRMGAANTAVAASNARVASSGVAAGTAATKAGTGMAKGATSAGRFARVGGFLKTAVSGIALAFTGLSLPVLAAVAVVVGAGYLIYRNWDRIKAAGAALINWVKTAFPGFGTGVRNAFSAVVQAARVLINMGIFKVRVAMMQLRGWWLRNLPMFKQAAQNVFRGIAFIIGPTIKAAAAVIRTVWTALSNFWRTNNQRFLTIIRSVWRIIANSVRISLTLVSGVIRAGAALLTGDWRKAWSIMRQTVVTVWNLIKSSVRAGVAIVVNNVKIAWSGLRTITRLVWQGIVAYVRLAWRNLTTAVRVGVQVVRSVLVAGWNLIRNVTRAVWNGIRGVIVGAWNGIKAAAQAGVNLVRSVVVAGWNVLRNTTRTVWNGIKTAITAVWDFLKSQVTQSINFYKNAIQTGWNFVRDTTRSVYTAIKNFLAETWNSIRNNVRERVDNIRSNISAGWDRIKSNTRAAYVYVKDQIFDRLTEAWNTVKRIVGNVVDAVQNAWDTVKRRTLDAWRQIGRNMHEPLSAAFGVLKGIWNNILEGIARVLSAVKLSGLASDVRGAKFSVGGVARAEGGITGDRNGIAFARGGVAGAGNVTNDYSRTYTRNYARGGVEEHAAGGIGTTAARPRLHMWNEQSGSNEAFIVENRPTREQMPYLQTAARWHDMKVVPADYSGPRDADPAPAAPRSHRYSSMRRPNGTRRTIANAPPRNLSEAAQSGGGIGGPGGTTNWEPWVADIARQYVSKYPGTMANTYPNHGGRGVWGERHSVDWWQGFRGGNLPDPTGDKIVGDLLAQHKKDLLYYIWRGRIHGWGGSKPYRGYGGPHFDHVHATFDKGANLAGGGGGGLSIPNPLQLTFERLWKSLVEPRFDSARDAFGGDYVLKQGARKAITMVDEGLYNWIDEKIPDTIGGGGSSGPGLNFKGGGTPVENRKVGREMNEAMGWGGQWGSLDKLWTKESGWNQYADNPTSNAYGIPQAMTSAHNMPSGYGPPGGDPVVQIDWGLGYIGGRYNDPNAAWAHSQRRGWYAQGGEIPGRPGEPRNIMAHAGEIVWPRGLSSSFQRWANELHRVDGGGAPTGVPTGDMAAARAMAESIRGGDGGRAVMATPDNSVQAARAARENAEMARAIREQGQAIRELRERLEAGIDVRMINPQVLIDAALLVQDSPEGRRRHDARNKRWLTTLNGRQN